MAVIRDRLADEAGVTLIELLVVIVLAGVVMGATLTTFTQFERTTATNQRLNDAQDQVRVGVAGLARELRNMASPTKELPEAVVRNGKQDIVFQSVSSTQTRRVRYCYSSSTERLWRQVQFTPFTMPTEGACPDISWGSQRAAVENVVNGSRDVFAYNATDLTSITEVSATLFVDVNESTREPAETALSTSIFLRNQNRSPVASFTADVSGTTVVLNGSDSADPEGRALEFYWYDAAVTDNKCGTLPLGVETVGCIGQGVVYNYVPPAAGTRSIHLLVRDPATLTDEAPSESVCVPGVGVTC